MDEKISCLIIDDEPPARELLRHYLSAIPSVTIAGECSNGFEALKMIREFRPKLLFLDIQMPKIDGFELLELIDEPSEVIFCTAYDSFALKAFEMHAVDYLLKPFSAERLGEAVQRAIQRIGSAGTTHRTDYTQLASDASGGDRKLDRVIAKTGTTITVIPVETIQYLEAQDDYVLIVSEHGNYLKEKPMKYYELNLPESLFVRIHRSYLANIRQISDVSRYGKESYRVKMRSGAVIRASASGYKLLREAIG